MQKTTKDATINQGKTLLYPSICLLSLLVALTLQNTLFQGAFFIKNFGLEAKNLGLDVRNLGLIAKNLGLKKES